LGFPRFFQYMPLERLQLWFGGLRCRCGMAVLPLPFTHSFLWFTCMLHTTYQTHTLHAFPHRFPWLVLPLPTATPTHTGQDTQDPVLGSCTYTHTHGCHLGWFGFGPHTFTYTDVPGAMGRFVRWVVVLLFLHRFPTFSFEFFPFHVLPCLGAGLVSFLHLWVLQCRFVAGSFLFRWVQRPSHYCVLYPTHHNTTFTTPVLVQLVWIGQVGLDFIPFGAPLHLPSLSFSLV